MPAFAEVLETYLAHLAVERGLSANTLAAYRRDLTRYAAFLDGLGRTGVRNPPDRGL